MGVGSDLPQDHGMTDLLIIAVLAFSFFGALAALAWVGDHLNLTQPEPERPRPVPVEPCDFAAALRLTRPDQER